ncbi:MAG: VWA domain-containing protein [Myxococcota bacterium]
MTKFTVALTAVCLALATAPTSGRAKQRVKMDVAVAKPVVAAGVEQKNYLKIGLTGFEPEQTSHRSSVNLAIVLDRSSSMAGEKFERAKAAALMVVDRLSADDILSVITYDSTVDVLVPATKVRDRDEIKARIRRLASRGSTALFAGVSRGIEEVRKFLDARRINRVILLSDGQANIGPSSPNELGRLGAAAGKQGIAVTTIGLGLGYNEDLMARLAERSDGNHGFAESAGDLATLFDAELKDVLSVVAQEVSVALTLPEGVRAIRVLNRDGEIHGQTVYLKLNQIYAKQQKYFLVEVAMPVGTNGQSIRLGSVAASYSNIVSGKTDRLSAEVSAAYSSDATLVSRAENQQVMVAVVEAIAVTTNAQAVALRDEGRVQEAERSLLNNAAFLRSNARKYKSKRLDAYGSKNEVDAKNLDSRSWTKQRKTMRKKQHELRRQQSY